MEVSVGKLPPSGPAAGVASGPAFERSLHAPERVLPPFVMIAGRSYLSNRVVPTPEACFLPRRRLPAITATLALDDADHVQSVTLRNIKAVRRRFLPVRDLSGSVVVDLRWIGLSSWFQGVALAPPYALMLASELREAGLGPVRFVIPERTIGKVATLLRDIVGDVVAHDGRVKGRFVTISPKTRGILDRCANGWMAEHGAPLLDRVRQVDSDLPRKIFLDRKTRAIANADEIAPILSARGYERVFAEELSVYEQIALLCRATHVVAIHGAALSPLVYRTREDGPLHMIEIMSPGHVVPSFRNRVLGLDLTYFAVRGLPDARTARDAFDPDLPWLDYARRNSRRSFRVDPLSLEIALEAGSETDLYDYVWGTAE